MTSKQKLSGTRSQIEKFFEGRPKALKLFDVLKKAVEKNGQPEIEVQKTQITFSEDHKYLWVWLPQKWVQNRSENSITITILTGKKNKSHRIVESVSPKKGYWTHHVIIENAKDIDGDISGLINESREFCMRRTKAKQKTKPPA